MIDNKIKNYVNAVVNRAEKNIVNFSAESMSTKEVSDGVTKVYPNTTAKTITFETIADNQFKTVTIDPGAGNITLNNGIVSGISDKAGEDNTIALSQRALIDVQEQIDKKADKDHTHTTFSNDITIDNKTETFSYPLSVLNSSISENTSMVLGLGKARDTYQCAKLEYYYSTTDPYLQLSLYSGGAKIRIYKDKMEFNSLITSQNTITAWNFKTKDGISLYDVSTKLDSHTHTVSDITDYTPYDDTEIKTLIANRPVLNYVDTFAEMISNWTNYPNKSFIFVGDGPEENISTFIVKYNDGSAFTWTCDLGSEPYLYTRFVGIEHNWNNSPWYKIPIINPETEKLIADIIPSHKHKLEDITDYTAPDLTTFGDITVSSLNGAIINPTDGQLNSTYPAIPIIKSDGIMEIGRYLDFHTQESSLKDYGFRLENTSGGYLEGTGYITAYNLKSDNETRLAAVEKTLSTIKSEILQTLYPVGSIYTSMTSTSPNTVFGFGTWTQITDRFLYCANSSKQTGGSSTHSHEYGLKAPMWHGALCDNDNMSSCKLWNGEEWTTTSNGLDTNTVTHKVRSAYSGDASSQTTNRGYIIGNTGTTSSMPPYITVYAWYRTA